MEKSGVHISAFHNTQYTYRKLRLLLLGGVSNNDQGSPLQQTVEEISGAHVVLAELGKPSARLEPVVTLHLVQGGQER